MLQGDGAGGHVAHPEQFQFMPQFKRASVFAFGLAKMDNGEILFLREAQTDNPRVLNGQ